MSIPTISRRTALSSIGALAGSALIPNTVFSQAPSSSSNNSSSSQPVFSYCLNTSTLRGHQLGFVNEIELAAEAGFDGIEIWLNGLQSYKDNGGSLSDLKLRVDDLGIKVEDAIGFAPWISDDVNTREQAKEQLKREMDMLAQIGCQRIAAPPVGATAGPSLDLVSVGERYRAILEIGVEMGVIPQLEVWGFSQNLSRLSEAVYVAIESGHPAARLLPDVFHLYKGGNNTESLKLLSSSSIEVFHLNDYPSSPGRDEIDDSYRVYPGDGVAPLQQILTDLADPMQTTVLSLELFNASYWERPALEVAITGLQKMKAAVSLI